MADSKILNQNESRLKVKPRIEFCLFCRDRVWAFCLQRTVTFSGSPTQRQSAPINRDIGGFHLLFSRRHENLCSPTMFLHAAMFLIEINASTETPRLSSQKSSTRSDRLPPPLKVTVRPRRIEIRSVHCLFV